MSSNFAPKILLQEPYTEISFDADNRVIIARWKGTLSIEQVRHGCQFMTDFIREQNLQQHLSDHTDLKVLSAEVQDYLAGEWFFEVEKEGLRKVAVRLAKDIFAQATVRKVNRSERYRDLQIESFTSCEEAYDWLLQR